MTDLVHEFIFHSAMASPQAEALAYQDRRLDYAALATDVQAAAAALLSLGLGRGERLAVYLEKRLETIVALFAAVP